MQGARQATRAGGALRWVGWDGLVLLALPLALLGLDSRWVWGGPGRDEWIYYGYFRFARLYLADFGGLYYSSRLSVILPGYLTRHLLPPLAANLVLHLGMYGLAAGSFYLVARVFSGRRAALLATLVLGSQPFFLRAIGWNYVDGFGITYFLLTAACLVLATRRPAWRPRGLAAAGAGALAIVAANLFYALYLPFLGALFLAAETEVRSAGEASPSRARRLCRDLLWAAAGAAAAFAVLAAVGHVWGHGPLLFLAATTRFLLGFAQTPSIFKHPASQWLRDALWLGFPVVVLGSGVAVLVRCLRVRRVGERGVLFTQLQYLAFFAAMLLCELLPQGVTFEYAYYASLLLPSAGLALAGQLSLLVEGMTARSFAVLAAATAAALAGAEAVPLPRPFLPALPAALLPLLAGLGCWWIAGSPRRGLRPALLFLALLAATHLLVQNESQSRIFDRWTRFGGKASDYFLEVDQVLSTLRNADPNLKLRLWYALSEDRIHFYDTVASGLLLCPHLINGSFPDPLGGRMCDGQTLGPGLTIAVLSQRPDAASAALRSLGDLGLGVHLVGRTVFPGPAPPFAITFLRTELREAVSAPTAP